MNQKITRIVLTGGPCAGKTTALSYLRQKLEELGYYVITVPEAATILINAGISPAAISIPIFQKLVIENILTLERTALETARYVSKNVVLLCDRGIPDGGGYVSKRIFLKILKEFRISLTEARDARYDAVFHLRTAAFGAEKFYTLANNAARRETPKEARAVDERTLRAWIGHPHLRVINNREDFDRKLKYLYQEVCHTLGIPVPLEIERKFLVRPFIVQKHLKDFQTVDIEQNYLQTNEPGVEVRVRKRGQNGSFVHYRTQKEIISPGVRSEAEHIISADEYRWSLQLKQLKTRTVKKKRTCFVFKDQYFEYDRFLVPKGLHLLEIELTDKNQKLTLPKFIRVIKEVTGDTQYSNATLSRI